MTSVRKIPREIINHPGPMMSDDQLEALVWGWYYRLSRQRDRRGESAPVNHSTGLPESANDLVPTHRAVYGMELALKVILNPRDFVASTIYVDDDPKNKFLPEDQRDWKAAIKVRPEHWSEETALAIKENTFRLKLVLHRLAERGYFNVTPEIDDPSCPTLGTSTLILGEDGLTLGARITYEGIKYAEAFVQEHPWLQQGHTILDAMGEEKSDAPEWLKRELAHRAINIQTGG